MFLNSLILEHIRETNKYRIKEDFLYKTTRGFKLTVSAGTISDLASIPRLAKFIIDDNDPHILEGAVVHDLLYGMIRETKDVSRLRRNADIILRDAMKELKAPYWKHTLVYYVVRVFGGSHVKS